MTTMTLEQMMARARDPSLRPPPPPPAIIETIDETIDQQLAPVEIVERIREPSSEETYASFVMLARSDPTFLTRLASQFQFAYPFAKAKDIARFPFKTATTIEIALSDKGKPKTKTRERRERRERETMRFTGAVQVCAGSNGQLSVPDWSGRIEFRNPARAKVDAARHLREGNFSQAFAQMVNEYADAFDQDGIEFGFLRTKTEHAGSPALDGFLFLASYDGLANRTPTMFIHAIERGERYRCTLPPFATTTSSGNALRGGFVMQCRAARDRRDWSTGRFEISTM